MSCGDLLQLQCTVPGEQCTPCASGENYDAGACAACPAGCTTCFAGFCLSCADPTYTIQDGKCAAPAPTAPELSLARCPASLDSLPPVPTGVQRFTAKLKSGSQLTDSFLASFRAALLASINAPNSTLAFVCYIPGNTAASVVSDLTSLKAQSSFINWQTRAASDPTMSFLIESTEAISVQTGLAPKANDDYTWPNLVQLRSKLPLYLLCGLAGVYLLGFGVIWIREQMRSKETQTLAIYQAFPDASSTPKRVYRAVVSNHLWVSAFAADPRSSFSGFKRLTTAVSAIALQMAITAVFIVYDPVSPPLAAYGLASAIIASLYMLPVSIAFSRPDKTREVARDILAFVVALCVALGSSILLLLLAVRFIPVSGKYDDLTPSWAVTFMASVFFEVFLFSPAGLALLSLGVHRYQNMVSGRVMRVNSRVVSVRRRKESASISEEREPTPKHGSTRTKNKYSTDDDHDSRDSRPQQPNTVVVLMPIVQHGDEEDMSEDEE